MSVIDDMAAVFRSSEVHRPAASARGVESGETHFQNWTNVRIRDGGSVIPWMIAARCVIHNACTTGIEAYILNRPVTEYHPASDPAQRIRSRASRQGHRLHPHHRRAGAMDRGKFRQGSSGQSQSVFRRSDCLSPAECPGAEMPIPKWPQPWKASAPLRPGLS